MRRSAILVAVATAVALSGCGSSAATHRNHAKRAADTVTGAQLKKPGRPEQVPISATTPTLPTPSTGTKHATTKLSTVAVIREVNVVCASVRTGAPSGLTKPFTKRVLLSYSRKVSAPTRRTVVSLGRLEQLGDTAALKRLVVEYSHLQGMYDSIGAVAGNAHAVTNLGKTIVTAEQALTATARAERLPACGVLGA